MAIPGKRTDKRLIGFVTKEEMDAIVAATDQNNLGRAPRPCVAIDHLQYRRSNVRNARPTLAPGKAGTDHCHLAIEGKGRTERLVPLWPETTRALKRWMDELGSQPDDIVFCPPAGSLIQRRSRLTQELELIPVTESATQLRMR